MAKILVVDDDPDIIEAMQDFLEDLGHIVLSAQDGIKGYQRAIENDPDLIILDVDMPGKTGLELCSDLRKVPETMLTPIVILTGFVDDDTLLKGLEAGCDDFLNKPPNIPVLQARVNSLLRISHQRNQIIATNETLDQKVVLLELRETELRRALDEKEALLKELYHRTKNNMQSISSLLNLQMYQTKDPELGKAFQVTQDRIKSMALVHKQLYQSKSLNAIALDEYISELTRDLMASYATGAGRINMELHCSPIQINLEKAVPIGLVINELLTNALKYAFPNEKAGKIIITEENLSGNTIRITISDDGIGLAEGCDPFAGSSLGFKLIRIITEDQLEGKLTFLPDTVGLTVMMEFSLN